MVDANDYFEYLHTRSWKGIAYRKYWLYPRISKYFKGRVLDVGCGIGDMLEFYNAATGVDVNPKTVEYCVSKGLSAKLMATDELPFKDGTFESVLLDNVLEHLEQPEKLLSEINRVLVTDGRVIIGVPGKKGYTRDPDHKIYYNKSNLSKVLKLAGFSKDLVFAMPFESDWLDMHLSQYCVYGVFKKND